jgi:hypothetical protein
MEILQRQAYGFRNFNYRLRFKMLGMQDRPSIGRNAPGVIQFLTPESNGFWFFRMSRDA